MVLRRGFNYCKSRPMPTMFLRSHSDRVRTKRPLGYKEPPRNDKVAEGIHSSNRWTRLSRQIRSERPLCERCHEEGRLFPSTEVHHIRKCETHPEMAYNPSNLRALCKECHLVEERKSK
jgi:5-methylcytosine-specific restriction enzyme A